MVRPHLPYHPTWCEQTANLALRLFPKHTLIIVRSEETAIVAGEVSQIYTTRHFTDPEFRTRPSDRSPTVEGPRFSSGKHFALSEFGVMSWDVV